MVNTSHFDVENRRKLTFKIIAAVVYVSMFDPKE